MLKYLLGLWGSHTMSTGVGAPIEDGACFIWQGVLHAFHIASRLLLPSEWKVFGNSCYTKHLGSDDKRNVYAHYTSFFNFWVFSICIWLNLQIRNLWPSRTIAFIIFVWNENLRCYFKAYGDRISSVIRAFLIWSRELWFRQMFTKAV